MRVGSRFRRGSLMHAWTPGGSTVSRPVTLKIAIREDSLHRFACNGFLTDLLSRCLSSRASSGFVEKKLSAPKANMTEKARASTTSTLPYSVLIKYRNCRRESNSDKRR